MPLVVLAVCALLLLTGFGIPSIDGGGHDGADDPLAPGFKEPPTELWFELQKPVERYFYVRKQAVLAHDMRVLWREYPELRVQDRNRPDVNAEGDWLRFYPRAIDGNQDPGAEHMRVKATSTGYDVFVHGWEMYTFENFDKSGGELPLTLSLERRGGKWTVVRTDEVTEAEYHDALEHD